MFPVNDFAGPLWRHRLSYGNCPLSGVRGIMDGL
jgi:hypothetical protein